jgi:hypothetical protein
MVANLRPLQRTHRDREGLGHRIGRSKSRTEADLSRRLDQAVERLLEFLERVEPKGVERTWDLGTRYLEAGVEA